MSKTLQFIANVTETTELRASISGKGMLPRDVQVSSVQDRIMLQPGEHYYHFEQRKVYQILGHTASTRWEKVSPTYCVGYVRLDKGAVRQLGRDFRECLKFMTLYKKRYITYDPRTKKVVDYDPPKDLVFVKV